MRWSRAGRITSSTRCPLCANTNITFQLTRLQTRVALHQASAYETMMSAEL